VHPPDHVLRQAGDLYQDKGEMRPDSLLVPYRPCLQLVAQGLEAPRPFRAIRLWNGEAVDLLPARWPCEGYKRGLACQDSKAASLSGSPIASAENSTPSRGSRRYHRCCAPRRARLGTDRPPTPPTSGPHSGVARKRRLRYGTHKESYFGGGRYDDGFEQEAESGDIETETSLSIDGNNDQTVGLQEVSNTGNFQNAQGFEYW
jgi:hypothetical protein